MRTRRLWSSSISETDDRQRVAVAPRRAQRVEVQRVDQVDDLHVARQQPLHQRHRPALQRLGQQRVVGVGEAPPCVMSQAASHGMPCTSTSSRISSGTAIAGCVSLSWIATWSGSERELAVLRMCRRSRSCSEAEAKKYSCRSRSSCPAGGRRRSGRARARSPPARTRSASAPTWSPRLKASRRSGSAARADHRRSVLTCAAAPADDRRVVGHRDARSRPAARLAASCRPAPSIGLDGAAEADGVGRPRGARTPTGCRRTASPRATRCCQPSFIACRNRPWS